MPAPIGWDHRDRPGPVGALARWHGRRRVARVRAALDRHRPPATPPEAYWDAARALHSREQAHTGTHPHRRPEDASERRSA